MISSSSLFSEYCTRRLNLLANETRFQILQLLREKPHYVGEINQTIPIEQSLLSYHLKLLRDEGLIRAERRGKGVFYDLAPEVAQFRAKGLNLGCCLLEFKS